MVRWHHHYAAIAVLLLWPVVVMAQSPTPTPTRTLVPSPTAPGSWYHYLTVGTGASTISDHYLTKTGVVDVTCLSKGFTACMHPSAIAELEPSDTLVLRVYADEMQLGYYTPSGGTITFCDNMPGGGCVGFANSASNVRRQSIIRLFQHPSGNRYRLISVTTSETTYLDRWTLTIQAMPALSPTSTPTPTHTPTPDVVYYATLPAPLANGVQGVAFEYRITAGQALTAILLFLVLLVSISKWFANIIIQPNR